MGSGLRFWLFKDQKPQAHQPTRLVIADLYSTARCIEASRRDFLPKRFGVEGFGVIRGSGFIGFRVYDLGFRV